MGAITSGTVKMHLHRVGDWKIVLKGEYGSLVDRLAHAGYNPYLLFVDMKNVITTTTKASTPHVTDTEVFPANAKLGRGGANPVNVYLVSDVPLDVNNSVYVIGWGQDGNGNSKLIAEEMALNGLTNVVSTRQFYEVFHMYSLKDCIGNVILKNPAGATLLTITIGGKHSNGSGFTVPLEWQCAKIFSSLKADLSATFGWLAIKSIEEDSNGIENGYQEVIWQPSNVYLAMESSHINLIHRHKDSNNNELRIEHHMCYESGAITLTSQCIYVLWEQTVTEIITD